jgi:hypothetical protein
MFNAFGSFVKADKKITDQNAIVFLAAARAKDPTRQNFMQFGTMDILCRERVLAVGQIPRPGLLSNRHYKFLV